MRIGMVYDRPICVDVRWAMLNGKKVMFYDGVSELVDWAMIDKWIDHYMKKNFKTRQHSNASNFANCFEAIGVKR